jgi:hypothetical protein
LSRVLLLGALPTLLFAQTTQASPDQEIRNLLEEDQAARQGVLSPTLAQDDAARLARARSLVNADGFQDAHSYDAAATLFQHSAQLQDHLIARELALVACFRRATYSGMPALAEDRYLVKLGQPQRFGAHFMGTGADAKPAPIQESGDHAVTDALRFDYLQPTLKQAKTEGLPFLQSGQAFSQALPRLRARMKPDAKGPEWITDATASPSAEELRKLESSKALDRPKLRARILALYHEDKLLIPSDYRKASILLLSAAGCPQDFLLANELAAVAIMRLDEAAWKPFAESWDRFAQALGQPARYGTLPGQSMDPSVIPPVTRLLASRTQK